VSQDKAYMNLKMRQFTFKQDQEGGGGHYVILKMMPYKLVVEICV
jgi:hypothetical protein